jgi:NAD(P)-dependent dehydrogenase (short-subunit alcohol dehydrogenase family)
MTDKQRLYKDLISLEGRVAVITGAASGIGRASARLLADAGAAVALIDIDEPGGEAAAAQITDSGAKAKFYHCNVALIFSLTMPV